jgi:hypothetical protein
MAPDEPGTARAGDARGAGAPAERRDDVHAQNAENGGGELPQRPGDAGEPGLGSVGEAGESAARVGDTPEGGAENGDVRQREGDHGGDEAVQSERLYEVTVQLLTGRTHQIRAQLAAIGAPILGDVMYEPLAGALVPAEGPAADELLAGVRAAAIVENPIGLHAASLEWRGRRWSAEPPWRAAE